jgi:type IV pilus assembly protein PilQ
MSPFVALWTAAFAALTAVKGVSIVPAADRTEVVVEMDGAVTVKDFRLSNPERLVLDISGARHTLPRDRYPDINRGGVRSLRVSQFQPGVVRIVLDLARPVQYSVAREGGVVRVSFPNPAGEFSAWHARGEEEAGAIAAQVVSAPVVTPAVAAATRESVPTARPPARRANPPVTLFFKDTPIHDVLATIAEHAGRSIVVGKGIDGKITADIRNQPWDVALEALLQANGLAAREMESGIIRVDKLENLREQEKVEELVTRSFPIKFANVDSLMPAIAGLVSERGKVTRNAATNTLLVTDGRSIVEERIAPMITQLDSRTPQVSISAKIIFINRTALDEVGVTYALWDRNGVIPGDSGVVAIGGKAIAALGNASTDARVTGPTFSFLSSLVLGRYNLNAFIDALTSVSVADIQASPSVRTLDNHEAFVQVGEETPIRVVDVGQGGGTAPRSNVQLKNTGIILKVTPHVTGNQVLLNVHAERSGLRVLPQADIGFTFDKQASGVNVLVNNGETAVISGLTIVEKTKGRMGIPILMDLPILGKLFRKSIDNEVKKDLLIMVTPHIIREEGGH